MSKQKQECTSHKWSEFYDIHRRRLVMNCQRCGLHIQWDARFIPRERTANIAD